MLLQMIEAALTINIHGALGEISGNFAISLAAIRAYAGQWLICGSVSLCLFSIGIIQLSIDSAEGRRKVMIWSIYRLIAGFAIIIPIVSIRSNLPSLLILSITIKLTKYCSLLFNMSITVKLC